MLRRTNSKGQSVNAPSVVHRYILYNENMGGVDLADQLIEQYEPQFRSLKLWKQILFSLLMMASGRFMNAIFQTVEFIFVNTCNCLHHHCVASPLWI